MPAGLPGFREARHFVWFPRGSSTGDLALLRSVEVEGLAFVLAGPRALGPYADRLTAVIDDRSIRTLGLRCAREAVVRVIVTCTPAIGTASVNLLGPIVINPRTGFAIQTELDGDPASAAVPLASLQEG